MKKAVFLDRDGVVIEQVPYLHDVADVRLEKGVAEGVKKLHAAGFAVVVVTNQSGVARKLFTMADVEKVHAKIQELLAETGEKIDGFYVCPHHPEYDGECLCRKPKPGLLLQAARELDLDLERSVMCGDKLSDVQSGINARCALNILIRTGYGRSEESAARAASVTDFCDDFAALAEAAVNRFPR
ncbi:MAG: D-glycero-beta-D-manno-heptose 1,7-bisphosphate 7-phosphatase [Victivallaceae bacterium]|nr:D-glycero-beta-D-manno-heptose 1,7-bisphosphate 7-phosphatase [Victivallaceae bacterium]